MNYLALLKSLKNEAATSTQYRLIESPYSVLAVLALIPVYILRFFTEVSYVALVFFFNGASSGIRYLENWVDNKKKDVNVASEAVLYFVTMPAIFLFNVFLSLFSLFFYFLWFDLQICFYITSLGGTRWQPFIMDAQFDHVDEYEPVFNVTARRAWSIVAFSLLALSGFIFLIAMANGEYSALSTASIFFALYTVWIIFFLPIFFKKAPVTKIAEVDNPLAVLHVVEAITDVADTDKNA